MLELAAFHCRVPGHGITLDNLTFTAASGAITALVGRSGSGGATLVRALAGTLPQPARIRGSAMLDGRRIDGATAEELASSSLWISDSALPGGTVSDALRILTGGLSAADDVGLADHLTRRMASLPIDLRLRLHCATLLPRAGEPQPTLVLVDRVLGAADASTREKFCGLLRLKARSGATVLWAEHDLDAVWEYADQVVELDAGRIVSSSAPAEWQPRTLPEPTLMTLSRALGVPAADCRTPRATRETMGMYRIVLPLFPHRSAEGTLPTGSSTVIAAESLGLTGQPFEVHQGESIGIIHTHARPEALARQLVRLLPNGDVVPSQLPGTLCIAVAARTWERRHHLPAGSVLAHLPTLHPRSLVAELSPGESAAFRNALGSGPETPVWLSHPQAGLDPRDRHTLAEDLRRRPAGTRVITSRDIEFLVRACHRLVVVADNKIVADGAPGAVVERLPATPLVSRAVGSTRYLRLSDVLSSTELGVPA